MGAISVSAGLTLIIVVATVVRFLGLTARPMYDEAASWTFARLPWTPFWKVMWDYEGNMVFYYLLLRGWVHLGNSETALRSLSVLFGVATIPAVYWLGSRLFNRRTGLISAALLAVHALHILESQEARSYALVTFFLVISTSLLVASLKTDRPRQMWAGYVVVSAFACYCQLLAVLVLISQWLWVGATAGRSGLRSRVGVLGALAILIAPIGLYAVARNKGQLDWVPPLTGSHFLNLMRSFAGGTWTGLLFLYIALCILATFGELKLRRESSRSGTTLLLSWLLFPVSVMTLLSLAKPILVNRFLLMCVPALVLLAASAIDQLLARNGLTRWAGAVVASVVFGLNSLASFTQYQAAVSQTNPFREMTRYVLSEQQPGDAAMFFTAATHLSFQYYATLAAPEREPLAPKIVIPNFGDTPTGAQPTPSVDEVRSASDRYRRVWLVLNLNSIRLIPARGEAVPIIRHTLEEKFDLTDEKRISNFLICLYTRRNT